MLAQQADLSVGELIWSGGDCHIYHNHFEQVKLQLSRSIYKPPTLCLKKASSIFDYSPEHIKLIDYAAHPHIKGDVAV